MPPIPPNIPPVFPPGYPALLAPTPPPATPTSQQTDTSAALGTPQWGLYLDNKLVLSADSVVSFSYKQDWELSNYPVEHGAFADYNKVQTPYDVRIRFTKGGSVADRKSFLDSVAAIAGDLKLYAAATPEESYTSVNIHHYDYNRTSRNGAGLLVVELWCEEIRELPESGSTTTASPIKSPKSPASAPTKNNGQINPQDATARNSLVSSAQQNAVGEDQPSNPFGQ